MPKNTEHLMSHEEAEKEASRLRELIERGEAKDYSEAEKKIEYEKSIKEISQKIEKNKQPEIEEKQEKQIKEEYIRVRKGKDSKRPIGSFEGSIVFLPPEAEDHHIVRVIIEEIPGKKDKKGKPMYIGRPAPSRFVDEGSLSGYFYKEGEKGALEEWHYMDTWLGYKPEVTRIISPEERIEKFTKILSAKIAEVQKDKIIINIKQEVCSYKKVPDSSRNLSSKLMGVQVEEVTKEITNDQIKDIVPIDISDPNNIEIKINFEYDPDLKLLNLTAYAERNQLPQEVNDKIKSMEEKGIVRDEFFPGEYTRDYFRTVTFNDGTIVYVEVDTRGFFGPVPYHITVERDDKIVAEGNYFDYNKTFDSENEEELKKYVNLLNIGEEGEEE